MIGPPSIILPQYIPWPEVSVPAEPAVAGPPGTSAVCACSWCVPLPAYVADRCSAGPATCCWCRQRRSDHSPALVPFPATKTNNLISLHLDNS